MMSNEEQMFQQHNESPDAPQKHADALITFRIQIDAQPVLLDKD